MFIIVALLIGICIGYCNFIGDKVVKLANYLLWGGLFFLLFIMGFEIGSNQQILANLNQLGLEALLLAGGSIIGSIVMLLLFSANFKEEQ
jgi:hypothetical protein